MLVERDSRQILGDQPFSEYVVSIAIKCGFGVIEQLPHFGFIVRRTQITPVIDDV